MTPFAAPMAEINQHTVCAADGTPILVFRDGQAMLSDPATGGIQLVRSNQQIMLCDGLAWSPSSRIRLAVCELCRSPVQGWFRTITPTHGLIESRSAAFCSSCGLTACRKHLKRKPGQPPLCGKCARWSLKKAILKVLFEGVE